VQGVAYSTCSEVNRSALFQQFAHDFEMVTVAGEDQRVPVIL